MDSYRTAFVDIRASAELVGRVDRDAQRIFLSVSGATGHQMLLTLTPGGAGVLCAEVEKRLTELTGEQASCPRCQGTGDLWIPVARGAVRCTDCPCGAGG